MQLEKWEKTRPEASILDSMSRLKGWNAAEMLSYKDGCWVYLIWERKNKTNSPKGHNHQIRVSVLRLFESTRLYIWKFFPKSMLYFEKVPNYICSILLRDYVPDIANQEKSSIQERWKPWTCASRFSKARMKYSLEN